MDDTISVRSQTINDESAAWLQHMQGIAGHLRDTHTFVLQQPDQTPKEEGEVFETCKALAEAGLFRLPYENCWVEVKGSFNMRMSHNPKKHNSVETIPATNCLGCMAWDLRTYENMEDDKIFPDEDGIVTWVFIRLPSDKGFRWYDLMYANIMLEKDVAQGQYVSHVIPVAMPTIIEAVSKAYRDYTPSDWDDNDYTKTHTDFSEAGVYLGTRLITTFITSLNTSWVTKTEKRPTGNAARASVRMKKKSSLSTALDMGRKRSTHRSYILIDSFHNSALATSKGKGSGRRKMIPHMRRGHIHKYWTGPKDIPELRKLVSKFVQPTFVNVPKEQREKFAAGKPYVIKTKPSRSHTKEQV